MSQKWSCLEILHQKCSCFLTFCFLAVAALCKTSLGSSNTNMSNVLLSQVLVLPQAWVLMHALTQISLAFAHKRKWQHQLYLGQEVRAAFRRHVLLSRDAFKRSFRASKGLKATRTTTLFFDVVGFCLVVYPTPIQSTLNYQKLDHTWRICSYSCGEDVPCPSPFISITFSLHCLLVASSSPSNIDRGQQQSKVTRAQFLMYNIVPQMAS